MGIVTWRDWCVAAMVVWAVGCGDDSNGGAGSGSAVVHEGGAGGSGTVSPMDEGGSGQSSGSEGGASGSGSGNSTGVGTGSQSGAGTGAASGNSGMSGTTGASGNSGAGTGAVSGNGSGQSGMGGGSGSVPPNCPATQAQTATGCVPCLLCDGLKLQHEAKASASSRCVCTTPPGSYFNDVSGGVGVYPCDADGDGWVRDSARFAIESVDPVVKTNARCNLRTVQSIVIQNVDGENFTFPLAAPLPLYESVRNDDALTLMNSIYAPAYGVGGRQLEPAEVNSFTKGCASQNGDFNDNKVADVAEWARPSLTAPSQVVSDVASSSEGRAPFADVYTRYSYFLELNLGLYEATCSVGSMQGAPCWHITERGRMAADPEPEPIGYGTDPATHMPQSDVWHSCTRVRDTWYDPANPPIGMDFASVSGPELPLTDTWHGMNHHSQFKCVEIVDESTYTNIVNAGQQASQRHLQAPSQFLSTALNWSVNQCAAQAGATAHAGNPSDPNISCAPLDDTQVAMLRTPTVTWAAARFDDPSQYRRSCLNACPGQYFYCPGGTQDAGCYTACADFSASGSLQVGTSTGYSIVGEVPANAISWSGTPLQGGGYSIEPLPLPGQ